MRSIVIALLMVLMVMSSAGAHSGAAPATQASAETSLASLTIFGETGHSTRGPLADFWLANGRLPVFGLPIRAQSQQSGILSQMFERARIEYHPANPNPYKVQLGLLGSEALQRQGRNWRTETDGIAMDGPCRSFETGRQVCGDFLTYWQSQGLNFGHAGVSPAEATALFGLPLTSPQMERNTSGHTVLTQWFERARFEFHPNNPAPYKVLLGRLGAEVAGEPAQPERLTLAPPRTAEQGRTWTMKLTDQRFTQVAGLLGTWPVSFTRLNSTTWLGIGGVDVLQATGPLRLKISALQADGSPWYGETNITIVDAGYESERINIPDSVNDAIARNQDKVIAERVLVNSIWPQVTPTRLWRGTFILPAEGRVSSEFGTRRSYNGGPFTSYHEGVDISNVTGTEIVAAARGRVVLARDDLVVRGGAVIIDHGLGIHTGYWHMDKVLAQEGQMVEQGAVIGLMGAKGFVTGPHLHWDLRIGALNVHPLDWTRTDYGSELK